MSGPSQWRAAGVYRVPYVDGTTVRVTSDEGSHFPPNRYDLVGTGGDGVSRVAAAAAGTVRRIQDGFDENRPDGDPCNNNFVWIEHPNGEWTKYTHMRQGSVADAGLAEDRTVAAGQCVGVEGDVGCAHGAHLHFEVAVPIDPSDPIDDDGFIRGGPDRNRIPWICGIAGRRFVAGRTIQAGPCPAVDVAVLPTTIKFAPVAIGQGATQVCTIVNLGVGQATVRVPASPGGGVFAWFPVTRTISRGDAVDVPLRFTPTSVLPAQTTMTVTIDGQPSVRVGMVGQGRAPDQDPVARIVAVPASVGFGSVEVGDDATRTCTLVNRSDRAVRIDVPGPAAGSVFRWFALDPTLAAGESVAVPIRFSPSGVGTARATVRVFVPPAPAPVEVELTGDGEPAEPLRIEPRELSFGQVQLGRSRTLQASITNPDDDPVTFRIDASAAGVPFRWSSVSAQIPAGGSRMVPVTFQPSVLGRVPATMSVAVIAPVAYAVRLSMSGTGAGGPDIP